MRRFMAALSVVLGLAIEGAPTPAAAESEPAASAQLVSCTADSFEALKRQNGVFVAWFHASWCPTCARQLETLRGLLAQGLDGNVYICQFDFDSTRELQQVLNVQSQGSMVRYERSNETSRLRGETKAERIRRFLEGP